MKSLVMLTVSLGLLGTACKRGGLETGGAGSNLATITQKTPNLDQLPERFTGEGSFTISVQAKDGSSAIIGEDGTGVASINEESLSEDSALKMTLTKDVLYQFRMTGVMKVTGDKTETISTEFCPDEEGLTDGWQEVRVVENNQNVPVFLCLESTGEVVNTVDTDGDSVDASVEGVFKNKPKKKGVDTPGVDDEDDTDEEEVETQPEVDVPTAAFKWVWKNEAQNLSNDRIAGGTDKAACRIIGSNIGQEIGTQVGQYFKSQGICRVAYGTDDGNVMERSANFQVLVLEQGKSFGGSFEWVSVSGASIPAKAYQAGKDIDDSDLFVCTANGFVGKASKALASCHYINADGSDSVAVASYQVLSTK